jgi:hypothetical protein
MWIYSTNPKKKLKFMQKTIYRIKIAYRELASYKNKKIMKLIGFRIFSIFCFSGNTINNTDYGIFLETQQT